MCRVTQQHLDDLEHSYSNDLTYYVTRPGSPTASRLTYSKYSLTWGTHAKVWTRPRVLRVYNGARSGLGDRRRDTTQH